jgi:hypothetical protein
MLGEPLLLGQLVSPSWPGLGVGLAATFAFLGRHPLKLALADRRARRRNARTVAAERFVLGYALLGAVGLVLASRGTSLWWMPMAAAAPLALVQLHRDASNRGRQLLPELLGGSRSGPSPRPSSGPRAGISSPRLRRGRSLPRRRRARSSTSERVRQDRGLAFSRSSVAAVHGLGVLAATALASVELAPWPVILAFGVLLVRSVKGLSPVRRPTRPQAVGVLEVAYGLGFLVLAVVGYRAGS